LIDYDGMFVPGMRAGQGSETGHKHFQHPDRRASDFGPAMDRFSFIALDLSLRAVIADKSLYPKFREGGETIVFRANDFADPQGSEVFRRLLAMPKLKDQAQNFATVCAAPLATVPTLDDFLAGRNLPGAKRPITVPLTPAKPPPRAPYIPAYPVVDALNFSAALQRVGDRVELIGRIVEVTQGSRKRGKAPAKHYVFINFGSGRGNIVRISIWSEGLAKLKERPSAAWVGRWVSVTGLMEVQSKRQNYQHLSITLQDEGQIQQIDEAEAGFRLSSVIAPMLVNMPASPKAPRAARAASTGPRRGARNRAAAAAGKPASRPPQAAAASTPVAPPTASSPRRLLEHIPRWAAVAAVVAALLMLLVLMLMH
jgi:hypothetical protein